jgi:hypothetical protein
MSASNDPNLAALQSYQMFALSQVQQDIARGLIAPRFGPTFQSVLSMPLSLTPGDKQTPEQAFNAALDTFTNAVTLWYNNAQYKGNVNEVRLRLEANRPKWIMPGLPTPQADVSDPNVKAIVGYRELWYIQAVSSNQIQPAFFPSYIEQVTKLPYPPKGVNEEDFNANVNTSADAIRNWFAASQYSGNLQVISDTIESTKPKYISPGPGPCPPAPSCPPDPSNQTLAIANRFFKSEGGAPATVNFAGEFSNYAALSDADVLDITNLLDTSTSTANFNSIVDRLQAEKRKLNSEMEGRRTKAEAINQQFVEEKGVAGSVTKSKVMVLQDYILAGFAISYLFFAVVIVFYFTKQSEAPMRTLTVMGTLMVIVTAILYTWTSYLA